MISVVLKVRFPFVECVCVCRCVNQVEKFHSVCSVDKPDLEVGSRTQRCFCFSPPVLQLRLQQRRTREQLVDQGIMPREYSPCHLILLCAPAYEREDDSYLLLYENC